MSESTKAPAKKYRSKWTRIAVEGATTDGRNSLTTDGGFTTNLELESKLPEDTVDGLDEEPKNGVFTGVVAFYKDKTTGKEVSVIAGDSTTPKPHAWPTWLMPGIPRLCHGAGLPVPAARH